MEQGARDVTRSRSAARGLRVGVQGVANVVWPALAFATVAAHAERLGLSGIASMGVAGAGVLALLPLTLVAWMQVAGGARPPIEGRGWALGLVIPPVVAALVSGTDGPAWWAFEVGVLYLTALLAAYAWIVWVRPFASGRYAAWPRAERRFHLFAVVLQVLLLVPAAASAGVLVVVLEAGVERAPLALAGYALAWLGLTVEEVRWMRAASPLP